MRPTSQAYLDLLANPTVLHPVMGLTILEGGQPVDGYDTFPVTSGSITFDIERAIRGDLTFQHPVTADAPADLFDESKAIEIAPRVGYQHPGGTLEMFEWGVFMVTRTEPVNARAGAKVQVVAKDRSELVRRNEFQDRFTIPSDTLVSEAIAMIVRDRLTFPVAENIRVDDGATTKRVTYGPGEDPWQGCKALAAGAGYDVYFDLQGRLTIDPLPTVSLDDVVFDHGQFPNLLTSTAAPVDALDRPNSFTVVGDSSYLLFPVRGTVEDTNPTSPNWVGSRRGRIPRTIRSSSVFSEAKAIQVAREHFNSSQDAGRSYRWAQVPDFAIEPRDVVRLVDTDLLVDEACAITSITVPLGIGEMSVTGSTRIT